MENLPLFATIYHWLPLQESDLVYYFVAGSKETIKKVLNAANIRKMFGRKYSWHAITKVLEMGTGKFAHEKKN